MGLKSFPIPTLLPKWSPDDRNPYRSALFSLKGLHMIKKRLSVWCSEWDSKKKNYFFLGGGQFWDIVRGGRVKKTPFITSKTPQVVVVTYTWIRAIKSWRGHPWLGRSVETGNIWQTGQTWENFMIVAWNENSHYYEKIQHLLWRQRV